MKKSGISKKKLSKIKLPQKRYKKRSSVGMSSPKVSMLASIAVLVALCGSFWGIDHSMQEAQAAAEAEEAARIAEEERLNAVTTTTATVVAVGDNLYHSYIINYGKRDGEKWNYDDIYSEVKEKVTQADLAFVDEETIFTTDHENVSSYPSFATPVEAGDALVNTGFDVIEMASNHTDDFGDELIEDTINFWKTEHPEVTVIGVNETQEAVDEITVVEVNDIRIAVFDYTYGSNTDITRNGSKPWMINFFDKDRITRQIAEAKEISDCIIFVAHWGNEDEPAPSEYEKQWARYLNELGVDVIIGGHPHVLQPYETLTNSEGKETLVFYSLGNFVSTQMELNELLEGMGEFTIEKSVTGRGETTVKITNANVEPMVMHYNLNENVFKVYFLKDYTDELASKHGAIERNGIRISVSILNELFEQIMGQEVGSSENTDLLDAVFNADGTMTVGGETVSDSEADELLSPTRSGGKLFYFNSTQSSGGGLDSSDSDSGYDSDYDSDSSY